MNFFPSNVGSRTRLHNHSGLDHFDKFVSLALFPVSKKRTTAHLRTPFHYFKLTSRALTVLLLLPDSEKFPMAVWSPYYSFVVSHALKAMGHTDCVTNLVTGSVTHLFLFTFFYIIINIQDITDLSQQF